MTATSILRALVGGGAIGLAAALALVGHGRIAGISGILGHALDGRGSSPTGSAAAGRRGSIDEDDGRRFRLAFLAGLLGAGALIAVLVPSAMGASARGLPALAIAGVLVGAGTTWSNGCTSGHGVCGVARGSRRSLVAVVTFMVTGAITVALLGVHA